MVDDEDNAAQHRRALEALIREEIKAAGGQLPFDRFMELALYAPGLGYYVAGAPKLGPDGDFVTAPEISPLFARCLATTCREVLSACRQDGSHKNGSHQDDAGQEDISRGNANGIGRAVEGELLELGAGTGTLAAELLASLAEQGPLPERYLILEPSPDLAQRQYQTIAARVPELLGRCHWLDRLPTQLNGMIIANEVLDAMPVHRFQIGDEGQIQEVCVGTDGDLFIDSLKESAMPALQAAVLGLQAAGLATQPGYRSEINLRLSPWTEALSAMLGAGLLLVIDYGYPRAEFFLDERHQGTLVCHSRHRAHANPYHAIGLQDITAHVDFTALAEAGQAAGLELAGYTTQANFLIGCGIDALIAEAGGDDPTTMLELTAGVKQLLLPSAMGERFQVMGLRRGLDALHINGFAVRDLSARLTSAPHRR